MSPARWDWTQTGKVEPKRKRETVIGVGDSDTIPWYVVPSPSWYDEQETDVDIIIDELVGNSQFVSESEAIRQELKKNPKKFVNLSERYQI